MTSVADQDDVATRPLPAVVVPAIDARPRRSTPGLRRRVVVGLFGVGLAVVALGLVFQGPVEHVWYQSRQQAAAADLSAKRHGYPKGRALAVIQIPSIGLDLAVVEGDGPTELRGAPGHRTGTPLPGATGNSLIFGHRHGWGGPFGGLSRVRTDDYVVIKKRTDSQPMLFRVVSVSRVGSGDTRPLAPSDDHRVSLVTSGGGGRLVVAAVSGAVGSLSARQRVVSTSSSGSSVFNATVGILILLVTATVFAVRRLAERYRPAMLAAVVAPAVVAGLLALCLEWDLAAVSRLH